MLAGKLLPLGGSGPLPEFVSANWVRATTSSVVVPAPTGIQDGDLLVAVGSSDGGGRINGIPAGFSLITDQDVATSVSVMVAAKTASSESGSYSFSTSSSGSTSIAILVYRNATRVNTVGAGANSLTASAITPTYRGVLVGYFSTTLTNAATVTSGPSGMTQRVTNAGGNRPVFAAYDLSPQEATSSGAKTAVFSSGTGLASIILQVTNEIDVEPDFVAMAQTQNGSSSASLVINKPTGTQEGDLMVAVMAHGPSSVTWTGDTDWIEVADRGSRPSPRIAYKVAGASEGSSYTFTAGSASLLSGAILTYRYAAYDTIGASFTASGSPATMSSVTATASQSLLLGFIAQDAASVTLTGPTSMTVRASDTDASTPSYAVYEQSIAAGPTGTRTASSSNLNHLTGILLSIKPTRSL